MIHEAIHTLLNNVTEDNFPGQAPQSQTGDYVVFSILGTDPSNTKTSVSYADLQKLVIDIYSNSLEDAGTLADSIRTELDYYSGTVSGIEITSLIFQDQADDVDFTSDKHNIRQDYNIRVII